MLAVQWSVKYFFARNSPLFWKRGGEKKKKKGNYEVFKARYFKQTQQETIKNAMKSTIIK